MQTNTVLLTLACSATAHWVATCVMALYARHKVQYLALAWINGIFAFLLSLATMYSPIIAQAILESGHGESSLGKIYHNYFGLKCGTLWTGKSVNLRTGEEYTPGTYTTISANFRVFDTMEEGVKGYFEFLFTNRTRYNNLIGETDPYEYLVKIKADEYATSSNYVRNVYNVIKSYNLTRFDP